MPRPAWLYRCRIEALFITWRSFHFATGSRIRLPHPVSVRLPPPILTFDRAHGLVPAKLIKVPLFLY
jgi:hypothetical protein